MSGQLAVAVVPWFHVQYPPGFSWCTQAAAMPRRKRGNENTVNIEKLIIEVQNNPVLFDVEDPSYGEQEPQHAHLPLSYRSMQCVHNLTRRKRLVNACRLLSASVCNRY